MSEEDKEQIAELQKELSQAEEAKKVAEDSLRRLKNTVASLEDSIRMLKPFPVAERGDKHYTIERDRWISENEGAVSDMKVVDDNFDIWGFDSIDRMEMVYGLMFETEGEAKAFLSAWKKLAELRIKRGGLALSPVCDKNGETAIHVGYGDEEEKTISTSDVVLIKALNVLLKHYMSDDVAKELLEKKEGEKKGVLR